MLNINNILKILTILLIYALISSFLEIFYYDSATSLAAAHREQKEDISNLVVDKKILGDLGEIHIKLVDDKNDDDDNNGNNERVPITNATKSKTSTEFLHTTATEITEIPATSTVALKPNPKPSTILPTTNSFGITNLLDPTLKHFNLFDPNTNRLNPNLFASYHTTKNASIEARACLTSQENCKTIEQTKIGWPTIPRKDFKNIIKNSMLHTFPEYSEVVLEEKEDSIFREGRELTIHLKMKNGERQDKTYGGDFLMARLIQLNTYYNFTLPYMKNWGPKLINARDGPTTFFQYAKNTTQNYDNYFIGPDVRIPGTVEDFNNGTYQIKLPLRWAGTFKIQIFLMRKSEACTALIYGMNTIHKKSRVIKGIFQHENAQSELCGMFVPDLLPDGDLSNVCNFTEKYGKGNEWYCNKPENWRTKYPNFECGDWPIWHGDHSGDKNYCAPKWRFGDVVEEFDLDGKGYEDLVYEREIEVLPNSDSTESNDNRQLPASFQKTPGYWKNFTWYDQILPSNHPDPGPDDKINLLQNYGKLMVNKTFIKMGDSIASHISKTFDTGMKTYNKAVMFDQIKNYNAEKYPERTEKHFNFLNYENMRSDDCEPISGWGALYNKFNWINAGSIYITEGHPVNKDLCIGKTLYSSDAINRMKDNQWFGENYIILLTHGAHFASWHPIVFYNRLIAIRDAIIEFKKEEKKFLNSRPELNQKPALFIYKTPSYARGDFKLLYAVVSGFQMFRMREIAFKVFGNPYLEDTKDDDEKYPVKVFDQFGPTFYGFETMKPGNVHPYSFLRDMSSYMLADLMSYYGYVSFSESGEEVREFPNSSQLNLLAKEEQKTAETAETATSNANVCEPRLGKTNQFNLIPLVSFGGSGNTWVRSLIEQATGYYTGSYYSDGMLSEHLKGEKEDPDDLKTPVTKAHTIGRIRTKKSIFPKACIFIIRNPKDALVSQFARFVKHSHDIGITQADLLPENYDFAHFGKKVHAFDNWVELYNLYNPRYRIPGLPLPVETKTKATSMDICNHNIMFIEYEKLKNNSTYLVSILEKVVEFINHNNNFFRDKEKDGFEPLKFRKNCLIVNNEGQFHRQKKEKIEIDQYFSVEERKVANERMVGLNLTLAGHVSLPESYLFQ